MLALITWLGGRWALVLLALPPVALELYHGNVHLLIAAAVVLGAALSRGVVVRAPDQGHAGHRPALVRGAARVALAGDRARGDGAHRGRHLCRRTQLLARMDRLDIVKPQRATVVQRPAAGAHQAAARGGRSSSGARAPTGRGRSRSPRHWACRSSGRTASSCSRRPSRSCAAATRRPLSPTGATRSGRERWPYRWPCSWAARSSWRRCCSRPDHGVLDWASSGLNPYSFRP